MKKITSVFISLLLLSLCGCEANTDTSDTRFMLDTVVNISAECTKETLDGAFLLCQELEKKLSRTIENSDVWRLNNSDGFIEVGEDTEKIIDRSLYYSEISGGKFDITVYAISSLWDFNEAVVPSKNEIAEALKNVDYEAIEKSGSSYNLNGKKIDLGSVAKGYIADRILDYFKQNQVENGTINLGGNVIVFGDRQKVGIARPFSEDTIAVLNIENASAVTSGIYQRYIEENENFYHHIIDTSTGYPVENSLLSVTVIGESSLECDALSTVLMLEGLEKGLEIINETNGYEAVFIERGEKITLSDGLIKKNNNIYLK